MIDAALQKQADRRANYVRLAFRTFTEAREHHDKGDSMSMAVEAIRPVIEADERERIANMVAQNIHIQHPLKPAGVSVAMIPANPQLAKIIRRSAAR